jgi:hypothetical protein
MWLELCWKVDLPAGRMVTSKQVLIPPSSGTLFTASAYILPRNWWRVRYSKTSSLWVLNYLSAETSLWWILSTTTGSLCSILLVHFKHPTLLITQCWCYMC